MAQIKKTRPNRRKRLALRTPSLPQASASGAAGIGKTQSFPVPGEATRFFDGFSRRDALAVLALGLLAGVCYLPAMLWGGLIWDDFIWSQSRAVLEWSGLSTIWSWPSRIEQRGALLAADLYHNLAGTQDLGTGAGRLSRRQCAAALAELLAGVAFAAAPGRARSLGCGRCVRRPSDCTWSRWPGLSSARTCFPVIFYLTAVLVWLRFLEQPRPWRYGLTLLLFVAGLLSKSIVVTLPAALLIVQWWKNGRITVRDLQHLAPFFLVALLITAVDLSSFGSRHGILDYSLPERMLLASRALWFYAGKLAWPTDLAVIYPRWDISLGDAWAWLYLAGAAALAATLWFMRHRVGRGPLAGALFFAVTLSPVLGFVYHDYMEYSVVADRFQYLAGIGVITVFIGASVHGASRLSLGLKLGATGVMVVLLALLGTGTWRQAGIYRDEVTFFSHIVSLNPEARNAHYSLSNALTKAGRREEALAAARIAEEILRRALEIDPSHKATRHHIAEILRAQSRYEEALEAYRAVLEVDPKYAPAHAYMGDVLLNLHRYSEAVKPLNKALKLIKAAPSLTPDLPTAGLLHALLGKASWGLGRLQAGDEYFRRALELDPHNMKTIEYVAAAHFRQKRYRQALDLYRTLLEIDPERAATHTDIGATLYFLGRTEEAVRSLERALSLDPTLETARTNLEEMRKRVRESGK